MRISWGHKILFTYLAFVVGILFLVFKANKENFDLVTEHYYEAELKYQDVIDQKERVAQLSAPPKITHTVNRISIQLPNEFLNKSVNGEIYLYRPSDATKDVRKDFATAGGALDIALSKPLSGLYEIKLSWKADGKNYFNEQKVFF